MSDPAAYPGWTQPARPYDPGAWLLEMPVLSPYRGARPPKLSRRKSGDPHCPQCQPGKACETHRDYGYDPLWGIG